MKLIIQGMRRSGTTILFDLFREDPEFTCFYEPLAAAINPCYGGGSGMNEIDYFESIRGLRQRFLEQKSLGFDPGMFNHGAPKDPTLEFQKEFPEHVEDYLKMIFDEGENVLIKFTRASHKVEALHRLVPDAYFIHIVRDPRRVATSYLFGKNGKHRDRYEDPKVFFNRARNRIGWSSPAFSDYLISESNDPKLRNLMDYQRLLLIWADTFKSARESGLAAFGDKYMLVQHEELVTKPNESLDKIYLHLNRECPDSVRKWASENVKAAKPVYAKGDVNWGIGYEKVGLDKLMEAAGYNL
jgi:hypothetical protein